MNSIPSEVFRGIACEVSLGQHLQGRICLGRNGYNTDLEAAPGQAGSGPTLRTSRLVVIWRQVIPATALSLYRKAGNAQIMNEKQKLVGRLLTTVR